MTTTTKPGITFAVDEVPPGTEALPTEQLKESVENLLGTAVEACDSYTAPVVKQPGFHSLIAAADRAYQSHFPLVLNPDAIWLTIAQGFARHVANNAEALRARIVPHEGKVIFTVRRDDFVRGSAENPWAVVWPEFCKQIREHIGVATHNLIVCDFSTTGPTERAASEVVLMDTVQSYVDYSFLTRCGIPAVTLEGSVEDWERIRERVSRLGQYDLSWWTHQVEVILDEFIKVAKGTPTVSFWQNLYKESNRSGGPYISGWLVRLFPYLNQGEYQIARVTPLRTDLRNFLLTHPIGGDKRGHGLMHHQLPASISAVPFVWQYLDKSFDYQFLAGVMAITQDPGSKAIRPRVGWAVRPTPKSVSGL
ncbi:MAG: hypothetical protein C0467_32665 [Planctomycetaceae bacterium]|nr:hypothetical protein [Planctomycetaceae bacterium]